MGIYERLGVRTLINARGTYTYLSGSLMQPEVVEAMAEASRRFVDIRELEAAVGARLARLTGAESALVTAGAAAALTQGTAACVVGKDPESIKRLPDTHGLKDEAIIQKAHRNPYDQAIKQVGVKMVEVETLEEMKRAISPKTAMISYIVALEPQGKVSLEETLKIGKASRVPVFVDAAAELPPAENLTKFVKMGADLVAFSGGKGLRGPQTSGLLLGRRDLIEAAALNGCPNHSIGRPMKVGKEEIVGLLRAVELYLERDHEAECRQWESQIEYLERALKGIPGVETGRVPKHIVNHVPRLYLKIDPNVAGMAQEDVIEKLSQGDPRIEVLTTPLGLTICANTLQSGEEEHIARRLREILGRK
jgi:L-seryl-tRNA(Ser) seleniumtransferase